MGFNTNPIKTIESMSFGLTWGWAGLSLFLIILIPLFYYVYKFEGKLIKSSDKYVLLAFRLTFVFIILTLLAGFNISVTGWVPQKNKIAILLDSSKSMTIRSGKSTRFEQLKTLITKDHFIDKLRKKTNIEPEVFTFADTVSPLSNAELANFAIEPTGNQTNISGAIDDVSNNLGASNLLGIIAITDGIQTTRANLLNSVMNTRIPLYIVAPQGEKTKDIAINLIRPPSTGYLNSTVRVRGEIKLHNIATATIPLTIKVNGKVKQILNVKVKSAIEKTSFAFNIKCAKEGSYRYSVSAPIVKNELTKANNKNEFLIKVVRESLNVLIIAEKPSWDLKFIRIALGTDPNINLSAWTKILPSRWSRLNDFKVEDALPAPTLENDIKKADVIILRGVHSGVLLDYSSEIISKVQNGRLGILILASSNSFHSLGYVNSKLEQLLPVYLKKETWHGISGNMLLPSMNPPYNFLHLLDDPIENSDFFRTLPKFDGLYEYSQKKPGAEVLLSSTVKGKNGQIPFLLRHHVGEGNVAMFCGGPLWTFGFRLADSEHGFKTYAAFIINIIKWLANRKENAQVSIDIPSARGFTDKQSTLRVWVMNDKHQLQSDAQVTLNVTGPDKIKFKLSCVETSEKGCYETSFVPATPGLYKFKAKASYQGKTLGNSSAKLIVETSTVEFDNPDISTKLLMRIASTTGGLYTEISSANKLLNIIKPTAGKKRETKIFEVRNSFLILLLLLLLPILEWTYRRTRGLS